MARMEKPELEKLLNTEVVVHVKDGRRLKGVLRRYDEYMNLLLEGVEEQVGEKSTKHALVVVKGGNIQAITT